MSEDPAVQRIKDFTCALADDFSARMEDSSPNLVEAMETITKIQTKQSGSLASLHHLQKTASAMQYDRDQKARQKRRAEENRQEEREE